jgi:hypothetical protein
MKLVRLVLSIVMLTVCAVTYGQSPSKTAAISDAQRNFDLMTTLVGTWQGSVTSDGSGRLLADFNATLFSNQAGVNDGPHPGYPTAPVWQLPMIQ